MVSHAQGATGTTAAAESQGGKREPLRDAIHACITYLSVRSGAWSMSPAQPSLAMKRQTLLRQSSTHA